MDVVCIDDEKLALDFIAHQLGKLDDLNVIGTFQQPYDGLEFILENDVDVAFLDIQMPGIDGIELAEKILEQKPHVEIVFVTAYNEYAVEAFDLNAIDYLIKPIKQNRLQKTMDRLKVATAQQKEVKPETEHLLIRLGNNLSFGFNEDNLKPVKWRTAKARELFLYLLQNQGELVHKATILELLWGEVDYEKGYSILYTTVYNVRKTLQTYQEHVKLHNTNEGYILELNHVVVDVQEWEKQLNELPVLNEQSIGQYEEVMVLNSGTYLEEYGYIWAESEKQRLEHMWLKYAQEMVDFYEKQGQTDEVITWYQSIVARVPDSEKGHFNLMKMYAKLDKIHLVTKQYEILVDALGSLSVEPARATREWYKDYMRNNS